MAAGGHRRDDYRRSAVKNDLLMRLGLWLLSSNVVVAATLVWGAWQSLANSRDADEAAARQTATNLANSLSIEVGAELRLIENALTTVSLGLTSAANTREGLRAVEKIVVEQRQLLPHVAALRFADAHGAVLAGLAPGERQINIGQRPYFEDARRSDAMVLSEPLVGLVTDEWSIVLARRLQGEDGIFHGVVYALVTARHFSERFAQIDMGASGAVALRTDSLRLVARQASMEPMSTKGVGEAIVSQELLCKFSENKDRGWYITPTALDNVERITAYNRVRGYPLLVFTGLATQEFLAPWRGQVRQAIIVVVFIMGVTAGFSTYLYVRQWRERHARNQALKTAREQSLLLENDLVGMIRVRGRVNTWVNRAAHRIFGYAAGELDGQSTRLLYLNDATHAKIGEGCAALRTDGRFSEQLQMRRKDGQAIWIDLSGALVSKDESLWMMVDIDVLKRSETQAKHLALRDPLTGLANRRLLDVQLDNAVAVARRNRQSMALCYIDLDGFKSINDLHGHDAGDIVLNLTAQRLLDTVRGSDTVARLGGDEFAVVLTPVTSVAEAQAVMHRCLERIRESMLLDSSAHVHVDASMGVVMGDGSSQPPDLLRAADEAMYAAKRAGKGRIEIATAALRGPDPVTHLSRD